MEFIEAVKDEVVVFGRPFRTEPLQDLMGCLKMAVLEMGIPLEDAVACATMNPVKEIGIYDRCGSITPGKRARSAAFI